MAKLSQRLHDAAQSGVYRAAGAERVAQAVRGTKLSFARVSLSNVSDKRALMRTLAAGLGFPEGFGENWDALEDCLSDLSWRAGAGHVLVFEGFEFLPREELGLLIDVLIAAAEFWSGRGRPFYAVFVDPERTLMVAELDSQA